jgi:ArsR family metal-binding transcriptional regulator
MAVKYAMSDLHITTFPSRTDFLLARTLLERHDLPHEVITVPRTFELVGVPGLVVDSQTRSKLYDGEVGTFYCSGWVDYRATATRMPEQEPPRFSEDIFGRVAVMVMAPCVADDTRVRIIAHIAGDLTGLFPYLNVEMRDGRYNARAPNFTFMDQYRMVTLYPRRIAIAKADEIVDVWRVLEALRCRANEVWARRAEISPSYEMREKPPALEIYKRLPKINCRACGEATCLAFAVKLWMGEADLDQCEPAWSGTHSHLRDALLEICAGLGVAHVQETPSREADGG